MLGFKEKGHSKHCATRQQLGLRSEPQLSFLMMLPRERFRVHEMRVPNPLVARAYENKRLVWILPQPAAERAADLLPADTYK